MLIHSEKNWIESLNKRTFIRIVRPPSGCNTFIPPSKIINGNPNPHWKSTILISKEQVVDFIIRLDNNYLTSENLWAFIGARQLNPKIIDWLNKQVRPLIGN